MEQAKSNISALPRDIVGGSWLLSGAVALLFIFRRKKFWHFMHIFFEEIKNKTMRHIGQPYIRYNAYVKELARAFDVALKKQYNIPKELQLVAADPLASKYSRLQPAIVFTKIVAFLCMVIEYDCAYRFPTQDVFGSVDKEAARKNPRKEFLRLLDLYIERGVKLGPRIVFIRKVMNLFMMVSPSTTRLIGEFLVELDLDKVRLDEADWYFCMRRDTYNYGGLTIEERLKMVDKIDREKGHYFVKFEYEQAPAVDPDKLPSIKTDSVKEIAENLNLPKV
jgi:hypothetical protein